MQGIETLGYEVVETNPIEALISEGGIAQHQQAAEMLADFGRNGDTYIVHAAEGETVLPLEVLENNPRLKNMIFTQMEEMGLEPERYIVGNELNSLNPETGQPEFFLKFLKKVVKKVVNVVKKVAPVVLAIAAPILLPTMPVALAAGLGSTAGNLIQGNSLSDSLKSGVITGLSAGAANYVMEGSFLGSSVDPANVAGVQDLGTMFTVDNPFTSAINPSITAVGADVAAGGGEVGSGFFEQEFIADTAVDTGVDTAVDTAVDTGVDTAVDTGVNTGVETVIEEVVKPKTFIDGLQSAFTPGDDYGFGDFWSEFLSPGRESISAAAQDGYKTDLANFQQLYPNADASTYTNFINQLDSKYAPGIFDKFGPAVGTGLVGGLASDAILGTNIITPPEEEVYDLAGAQTAGADLLAADPETYGIDDSYLSGNPYYETATNMPVTTAVNPGFTSPVAPEVAPVETGIQTVATDIPGAVIANPNASNQYAGMLSGDYFSQTPYSNINYFQPPVPSPQFGINPPFQNPVMFASGGEIMGPGTPTSDSVPAMLSDGEFVMNARAVRGAGGGDRQQGAKRMYEMMRSFERTA